MLRVQTTNFGRALLAACALLVPPLTAGSVHAQPPRLMTDGMDLYCDGPFTCAEGAPDACDDDGATCGIVGGTRTAVCHHYEDSFFCCGEDEDCTAWAPDGTEIPSTCAPVSGLSGGSGVCIYYPGGDAPSFCDFDGDDPHSSIIPCLQWAEDPRVSVSDWRKGDCDGDGVSNGLEYELPGCDPCDGAISPSPGDMECTEGPLPDAGLPDTGPGEDAGPAADTGPPGDAGRDSAPGLDAGESDARGGSGVNFRGTGGCACDAASPRSSEPSAAMLFVVLALGLLRSSRRAGTGS